MKEFPVYVCPVDGVRKVLSKVNVYSLKDGYDKFLSSPGCCRRCIRLNPETKRKVEETSLLRHGTRHFNNAKKAAATNKERHGEKLEISIKKRKTTCLWRFGTEDGGNTEEANIKRKTTNMRKYNCEYASQSDVVKRKKEETWLNNLGVRNPMCSSEINSKRNKKWLLCWNDDINKNLITKDVKKVSGFTNCVRFDSKWEITVFMFCRNNNIDCIYQPKVKFSYGHNGKQHTYHPDFLINGRIYEVKGDYFFSYDQKLEREVMICPIWMKKRVSYDTYIDLCAKYESKHQCMIANDVVILREKDIKNLSLSTFRIVV